jgi:DNA-binding MarR family transcriptional regulator
MSIDNLNEKQKWDIMLTTLKKDYQFNQRSTMPKKSDLLKVNAVSTRAFYTWRILDNTRFAIARLRDIELGKMGITPEQAGILGLLKSNYGKATVTDFVGVWMRQRNSITTLVHRMTKIGLVKKVKIPGSKKIEVVLTPKGQNILARIPRDSLENVFSVLPEEEIELLSASLERLLLKSREMLGLSSELPFQE